MWSEEGDASKEWQRERVEACRIFVWLSTLGKIRAMIRQKEMLKSFEMSSRREGRVG